MLAYVSDDSIQLLTSALESVKSKRVTSSPAFIWACLFELEYINIITNFVNLKILYAYEELLEVAKHATEERW
jgi:hypothetical protein